MYSAYSKDVRPVGKSLIENFGSLNKVSNADLEALQNIDVVSDAAISAISCVRQAFVSSAREETKDLPIINN